MATASAMTAGTSESFADAASSRQHAQSANLASRISPMLLATELAIELMGT